MEAAKAKIIKDLIKDALKDENTEDMDPFFCQLLLFDWDQVTAYSVSMDSRGEYLEGHHLNALKAAHAMMAQEIARLEAIEIQGTELLQ